MVEDIGVVIIGWSSLGNETKISKAPDTVEEVLPYPEREMTLYPALKLQPFQNEVCDRNSDSGSERRFQDVAVPKQRK